MALQTFTAGQVLTAAQVNNLQANDYNQTVSTKTDSYTLVAADKGTRVVMNKATATTITVNTSLFNAGDTLWIHNVGAGVCTITAGTATVSTSGSLALAQNAGGTLYFTSAGVAIFFPTVASSAQGLTLLNTTSFSGVSSQSVSDVFSASYDNYKVIVRLSSISGALNLQLRLRVSGADNSANKYGQAGVFYTLNSSSASSGGIAQTNPSTLFQVGGGIGAGATEQISEIGIFNPFLTVNTKFTHHTGSFSSTDTYVEGNNGVGQHNVASSFTGFTLLASANNMTGIVSTYGVNK